MTPATKDRAVRAFFSVSVLGKAVDGALEVAGGLLLLFVAPERIYSLVRLLTQHELSEDPRDVVAAYLLNGAHQLATGGTTFAAIYLLWHGVVKVGLVAGLLLRRKSAYPAAIVAFSVFLLYQLYRYAHTHALALLVLSVLDAAVIVLTWLESRRLQRTHGFTRSPR